MKKMILAVALVALTAFGGQVFGEICTTDNVPAATLLIPYFQADISDAGCADPNAPTTFFSISNASDSAVIAHVTYWTDFSVPEIDFDVYLTGYDVQVIDVSEVFCTGNLPQTAVGLSPTGPFSPDPGVFPNCGTTAGNPPYYNKPAITANFQAHLQAVFVGDQSPVTGLCGGTAQDNGYAHGYITVDATNDCSLRFPSDPAYWTSGVPYTDAVGNVLWGDYAYIDRNVGTSEAFTAVHIEADAAFIAGIGPTFYGRYTDSGAGPTYEDGREPLPTTWGARYNRGAGFVGTYYQIWREGDDSASEVACGTAPWLTANCGWGLDFSNTPNALIAFNESEQVEVPSSGASGEPDPELTCIRYETQNINVGTDLPTSYLQGWYYMNLQNSVAPLASSSLGQAHLTVVEVLVNNSTFSGGWEGVALDGSCAQFAAGVTIVPAQPTVNNPDEP